VGARRVLVAFNVLLETSDLRAASAVARAIRASSGGLPGVQALAFRTSDPAQVQVSMNVCDLDQTSVVTAVRAVHEQARARGIEPRHSELVGLIPAAEVERAADLSTGALLAPDVDFAPLLARAARALGLPGLEARQVIELALPWR
jgi:glutamate formiminotransferase